MDPFINVTPPRGFKRIIWRLPVLLFRAHMGWLLTGHFLLLNHTGRVSGLHRRTVLEVLRYDKPTGTRYVGSGWGEKSDWYRNIQKTPEVVIQVGWKQYETLAERLPLHRAEEEILSYTKRFPGMLNALARVVGYRLGNTEEDYRAFAALIPVVAFRPR